MDLTGKVALVTGGGRGVGRATALALAEAGCDVAVVARSTDEIAQVADEIHGHGRRAYALALDLAAPERIPAALASIQRELGEVAILVNNAAVVEPLGPTTDVDPAVWAQALTVNLTSVFALTQAALPAMLRQGWGRVVAVSTGVASGSGMVNANAYSVSKAALEMWGRNLAAELAETGVTVNIVRPGTVDTAMQAHIRTQPAERVGAPMHERFMRFYESGALIAPELPARLITRVIAGDETGEVINIGDERGQALLRQA